MDGCIISITPLLNVLIAAALVQRAVAAAQVAVVSAYVEAATNVTVLPVVGREAWPSDRRRPRRPTYGGTRSQSLHMHASQYDYRN